MKTLTNLLNQSLIKVISNDPKIRFFRSKFTGNRVWDLYLNSFIDEGIFRDPESSEHNCNNCKNSITRYGNLVYIDKDLNIRNLYEHISIEEVSEEYRPFIRQISEELKKHDVETVFIETFEFLKYKTNYESVKNVQSTYKLGLPVNFKKYTQEEVNKFGVVNTETVYEFNHFFLDMPEEFIYKGSESKETVIHKFNERATSIINFLSEVKLETLCDVDEYIKSNVILDSKRYSESVSNFIELYKRLEDLSIDKRRLYIFRNLKELESLSTFRPSLIGTLCREIESKGAESAILEFNKRIDPVNYKRAKSPISKSEIERFERFVSENGLVNSFSRRFATYSDIDINSINHTGIGSGKIKLFDKLTPTDGGGSIKLDVDKIPSINHKEFFNNILPNSKSVELYFEGRLKKNLMTLTTSKDPSAPNIFGWDNPVSWTYENGLEGISQITQEVKDKGGKIDSPIRFSIMWNEDDDNRVDLDAHAILRSKKTWHTYYSNKSSRDPSFGSMILDIDIIHPRGVAVENIYFDISDMIKGSYILNFHVVNFRSVRTKGFKAEVKIFDEIFQVEFQGDFRTKMDVCTIHLLGQKVTEIDWNLKPVGSLVSSKHWGINSCQFHPVKMICESPNRWNGGNVGNLHYFFLVDNCKPEDHVVSLHIDNIRGDLYPFRKVIESLASKTTLQPSEESLGGFGFNETIRDHVILKVDGKLYRVEFN